MNTPLIAFETLYGRKVMGGRYPFPRSPSTTEELSIPLTQVSPELVAECEYRHEQALIAAQVSLYQNEITGGNNPNLGAQ